MHWQFGEMEFGEMKRNTSNWSNFCMLLRRAGLPASAGLSCFPYSFLVWRPRSGNVLEFLDETYPAKTRRMGLRNGKNSMILTSTAFTDLPCDRRIYGRTGDRSALSMLPRAKNRYQSMIDTSFWLQRSSRNIRNPYRQWCIFPAEERRPIQRSTDPCLIEEGTPLPPFSPSLASSFPVGPSVVECVGPTRWLIRPWAYFVLVFSYSWSTCYINGRFTYLLIAGG